MIKHKKERHMDKMALMRVRAARQKMGEGKQRWDKMLINGMNSG